MTAEWRHATDHGDLTAIERLLDSGADVDARDEHGQTALMNAARDGRTDVVRLLAARGARLDHSARFGLTALMLAVVRGHVDELEVLMDRLSEELSPLENFVLPGGCPSAAQLHVARTVCRRAERLVIALSRKEAVGPFTIRYLNRLSDALFVMARYENKRRGVPDVLWNSRA